MLKWTLDNGEINASACFQHELIADAETRIKRAFATLNTAIVVKRGEVIFAKAYDKRVALSAYAPVYSVTKSVVATLIGGALERGELNAVGQTLDTLLDEDVIARCSSDVKSITLHQLLSMTAGFKWPPARGGLEPLLGRILKRSSWVTAILEIPVVRSEVGQFNYNSAVSHLLSVILTRATGVTAEKLAKTRLFDPLNIVSFKWENDTEGYSTGGWGLSLSPVDMAKLGVLYLQHGQWNGEQLVDSHWVEQMWSEHTPGYGYQWWKRAAADVDTYCAQGLGGQFICCVPEHDIVIVLTSDFAGRKKDLWPMLETYWLPAAI